MWKFLSSNPALVVSILTSAMGIIGFIIKYKIIKIITNREWLAKAYGPMTAILIIVGISFFIYWLTHKPPTVAILSPSPSGSIEATAQGDSVWFSVRGTSSGVVSDNTLRIYVLVFSAPEWHVQRPATKERDGRWTLAQAWIGDASAPIRTGDEIRLIAVVSRDKCDPGTKFPDYTQLNPVVASEIVSARVSSVRGR